MRSITSAGLAKIQALEATEPITAIQVQWTKNAPRSTYLDKAVAGVGEGRIVSLGNLDFVITFDEGSDTAEVECTLNDTDGHLKDIIDSVDVHKRPVWIYQTFDGLSWADRIFIFRGEINSPIEWNEGDRTLKFRIVSKVEDGEVGFSIEEGQLPNPSANLIGKPWPLKFGTTFNVSALKVTNPLTGILGTGVGFSDFTLPFRIEAATAIQCEQVYQNTRQVTRYELDSTDPNAEAGDGGFRALVSDNQGLQAATDGFQQVGNPGAGNLGYSIVIPNTQNLPEAQYGTGEDAIPLKSVTYKPATPQYETQTVYTVDPSCALFRCQTLDNLSSMLTKQLQYEFTKVLIYGGEKFPQATQLTLRLADGGKIVGQFQGTSAVPSNIFLITARIHPDLATIGVPTRTSVQASIDSKLLSSIQAGCADMLGGTGYSIVGYDADGRPIVKGVTGAVDLTQQSTGRVELLSPRTSLDFYNAVPKASFHWEKPGGEVIVESATDPIVYITNLLPETVHNVSAYRTFGEIKQLTLVPASYYTVRTVDMGYYTTTEIVFTKPLSQLGDGWDDDTVYVTSTSTVGPNPVDIMIWLIDTYTTLDYDITTFTDVRTKLATYYNNFPLLERKNVLQVLSEIAFQNRCTIYLRDGVFFLKYLSEIPEANGPVSEDDVDPNTLIVSHTATEDLVTKLVGKWKWDYSKDAGEQVILRNNVSKYGTHEQEFEFYCFNVIEWVVKSATFWLIRKSNTYKKLTFTTPLNLLPIEPNDALLVTLPDLSDDSVICRVEAAKFNSEQQRMEFEVWTPVLAGTKEAYDYANPAYIPAGTKWPPDGEITAGDYGSGVSAPGFTVTAPAGHPLLGGTGIPSDYTFGPCEALGPTASPTAIQTCGNTTADTYPSDLDDTPITRDIIGATPPDTSINVSDIEIDEGPVEYLGGLSPMDELEQKVNQALGQSQEALSMANAANTAAGGGGSGAPNQPGDEPEDPDPLDKKPEDPPPDQACTTTVRVYMHQPTVLFAHGKVGAVSPGENGHVGASNITAVQTLTFKTCCEGKQVVKAILDQHTAMQEGDGYSYDSAYPMNANITCDSKPECEGWTPTQDCNDIIQFNDSEGPPPIITPGATGQGIPSATSYKVEPSDPDSDAPTGGKDWFGELTFDGTACQEEATEPEEGDPGQPNGDTGEGGLPVITPYNGCNGPTDTSPNSPADGA